MLVGLLLLTHHIQVCRYARTIRVETGRPHLVRRVVAARPHRWRLHDVELPVMGEDELLNLSSSVGEVCLGLIEQIQG